MKHSPKPTVSILKSLTPTSLINASLRAHPAFRFAIIAAGLCTLVSVVSKYGASLATLVFGSIALVVLMILFLVFTQAASLSKSHLHGPAVIMLWTFLSMVLASAALLFSSAFFNWPLPIQANLNHQLLDSGSQSVPVAPQRGYAGPDETPKSEAAKTKSAPPTSVSEVNDSTVIIGDHNSVGK